MSKLKALMSLVDDVKKTRDSSGGLFNYVPDSIATHANNQKNGGVYDDNLLMGNRRKSKNDSPGKREARSSNLRSPDGR